jgi:transcriptional regulator of acetoin/glycerol metabolism
MLTEAPLIDVQDLPLHLTERAVPSDSEGPVGSTGLTEQERQLLIRALADARGNQSEAAKRLGIGRDALRYKMKKHHVLS